MPTTTINFAYGSNMDPLQFAERCPNSSRLSNAVLLNYKFIMTRRGYASVKRCQGSQVEGVLYELTKADEKNLAKKYEGVPVYYKRKYRTVQVGSKTVKALVYVATSVRRGPIGKDEKPEYAAKILCGAKKHKLPRAYQDMLFGILGEYLDQT